MKNILLKKTKYFIILQAILELLQTLSAIFLMILISSLINFVTSVQIDEFVNRIPILMVVIIIQVISYYGKSYSMAACKKQYVYNIRNMLYSKIVHTVMSEKERVTTSDVLNTYNNEIEMIENYIGSIANVLISPFIMISIIVLYFTYIDLKLLIISCLLVPGSTFLYDKLVKPVQNKTKEILDEKNKLYSITEDLLKGFYIIKSYGLQEFFLDLFQHHTSTVKLREEEKDKINAALGRMFIVIRYIPQLIVPLYGGYLSFCGEISLGGLIAANTLIWYIIKPMEDLLSFKKILREIQPARKQIGALLRLKQEIEISGQNDRKENNTETNELVTIRNLKYSYNDQKPILDNINLHIGKEEHIALIGKSGAGKSTLVKIMCGLQTRFQGEVKIDGIRMNENHAIQIRRRLSYVAQVPFIFQGTISENIRMGKITDMEQVMAAAELACMHEFIMSLPDQYNTLIGAGGVKLSGGQCKRLEIARAIIHDGKLFIFDEPTSALDSETSKRLLKRILSYCEKKSIIMVSHDGKIYSNFNRIIELNERRTDD